MLHSPIFSSILDNLASLRWLLPEGLLASTLVVVLGLAMFLPRYQHYWLRPVAFVGVALAGYSKYWLSSQLGQDTALPLFNQLLILDPLAVFFGLLLLSLTGLLLLLVPPPAQHAADPAAGPAYVVLMLGALLGSCLLVMAFHWLTIYLGLSLVTLASALLIGSHTTPASTAASLKYLLYSMATTAVMLWGMGYLYGLTGTLALAHSDLPLRLQALPRAVVLTMLLLCLSSILFVLAAAPYHYWVPDVYQAAPAIVVAYVATVPKLAAAGVLLRLCQQFLPHLGPILQAQALQGLAMLALLSLIVGNAAALLQNNLQRLLAYGSIAQGGLLMAGIVAMPSSQAGLLYYSVLYGVMSVAAWLGIQALQHLTGSGHLLDCVGLGRQWPVLGTGITVVMLALVGLPPTAGFIGKFLLFTGLWAHAQCTGSPWSMALLAASLLSTVLSLYYYLKLPYVLFFKPPQQAPIKPRTVQAAPILMALLAILLLVAFFSSLFPSTWRG